MTGHSEDYQNAVNERCVKEAIIGTHHYIHRYLIVWLIPVDVAKIHYGKSHPTAQNWSVIVTQQPRQDDAVNYFAQIVVYSSPNDLSSFQSLEDSIVAYPNKIEALSNLLDNLERSVEEMLKASRVKWHSESIIDISDITTGDRIGEVWWGRMVLRWRLVESMCLVCLTGAIVHSGRVEGLKG